MKNSLSVSMLAIASVLVFTSCSTTSHVEVAQGVNFSNYKTFGWVNDNGVKKAGRANNDIVDNNIKTLSAQSLKRKAGRKQINSRMCYSIIMW
jgi:hypothetical protein